MLSPAVFGLALVLVLLPLLPAEAPGLIEISHDPFTNPDSQHATQVESDTFAFGSTVVAAFQSGRFFDGGASDIGFATSRDGGLTWTSGFLPGLTINGSPPGPYDRASDPSVAYDAAHDVWLIGSLALTVNGAGVGGAAIVVSRSADGGLSWESPTVVSAATGLGNYDKGWTACDNWPSSPHFGQCYTTWDDAGLGDRIFMSTSSDGGLTWSPKVSPRRAPIGLGGIPLPRPDGTVVVPASNPFGTAINAFASRDGGQTWGRTRLVSPVIHHAVAGDLRVTASLFSADVDASGALYVVWSDCRFRPACASNDLVMSTSADGVSWTPVVRIPIDATTSPVDHFLPGLALDHATSGGTAHLAVTYYYYPDANCTASTCQLLVGFVSSADGGATWNAPQTLAGPMSLSWLADTSQGRMVGDYISTSLVSGGQAVPVFAVANAPAGSVFDEAMYSLTVTPAPATARGEPRRGHADEPVLSARSDRAAPTRPLTIR